MTQPYDPMRDDARPSDDTSEVTDAVEATDAVTDAGEHEPQPHRETQTEPRSEQQTFGDERVDRAVERLAELDERAVSDHVEVFDDIHGRLRDALEEAAVDTSPP
jgi:hypothetical protein